MMEPWECQHDRWINGEHCAGCGISSEAFNQAMAYASRSNSLIFSKIGERIFEVVIYAPPGEPPPRPADRAAIYYDIGGAMTSGEPFTPYPSGGEVAP